MKIPSFVWMPQLGFPELDQLPQVLEVFFVLAREKQQNQIQGNGMKM